MLRPRLMVFGRMAETLGMNMIIEKKVKDLGFDIFLK